MHITKDDIVRAYNAPINRITVDNVEEHYDDLVLIFGSLDSGFMPNIANGIMLSNLLGCKITNPQLLPKVSENFSESNRLILFSLTESCNRLRGNLLRRNKTW